MSSIHHSSIWGCWRVWQGPYRYMYKYVCIYTYIYTHCTYMYIYIYILYIQTYEFVPKKADQTKKSNGFKNMFSHVQLSCINIGRFNYISHVQMRVPVLLAIVDFQTSRRWQRRTVTGSATRLTSWCDSRSEITEEATRTRWKKAHFQTHKQIILLRESHEISIYINFSSI